MKVNKMITLDYDIAIKLKKHINASKLINDLLRLKYSGEIDRLRKRDKMAEKLQKKIEEENEDR